MSVYPDASGSPSTRPTGKELRMEMKGQLQAVRQKATSGNTAHWCPEDRGNPTVVIVVLLRHNISSTQCLSRSYALLLCCTAELCSSPCHTFTESKPEGETRK